MIPKLLQISASFSSLQGLKKKNNSNSKDLKKIQHLLKVETNKYVSISMNAYFSKALKVYKQYFLFSLLFFAGNSFPFDLPNVRILDKKK